MIVALIYILPMGLCEWLPKVSVVIPVYNREGTLSACLDSVLKQSLKDLQIICVNDGSVDGSLKMMEDFARKDRRVVVLHQKNSGVSCARNAGLSVATGEYVNFIDSDDWIEFDMYEILYEKAKQSQVDVVLWGRVDSKDRYLGPAEEFLLWGKNSVDYLVPSMAFHERMSVCTKLYKRSMVRDNGVIFDVLVRFGEDSLFNLDLIPFVHGIFCVNRSFYHYNPSFKGLCFGRRRKDVIDFAKGLIRHVNKINDKHIVLSKRNIEEIQLFALQQKDILVKHKFRKRWKKKK